MQGVRVAVRIRSRGGNLTVNPFTSIKNAVEWKRVFIFLPHSKKSKLGITVLDREIFVVNIYKRLFHTDLGRY